MFPKFVTVVGASLLLALAAPLAQAQDKPAAAEKVLKLGHVGGTDSAFSEFARKFAAEVAKESKGQFRIEEYGNSVLGSESALLDAVKLGTVNLVITGLIGPLPTVAPETGVLTVPFLFRDEAHVAKVLDGPIGSDLLNGLHKYGFQGLAWGENGFRQLTTNNIPVRTAADVKKIRIRVAKGNVTPRVWRDLGAAAVVELNVNDVYGALKRGEIDAQENPLTNAFAYNFFDFQNHVTLLNYVYSPLVLLINNDDFDELSPENKDIFTKAAHLAGQWSREFVARNNRDVETKLKAKGTVFITDPDLASFRQALKPTLAEFSAKFPGVVDKIQAVQ